MIQIEDAYLEDEIRDGFYIPSMTKRTWAMELTVLDLIDSICNRHNITYFADWGTMLGAVRHGGFVPWDDDMDICMHRNDFDRFKRYADEELPDGYSIMSFNNNDYSWKFIVNVVPNDHMCFTAEYLKTHYAFPYIVAVDIFIIDNVSDDDALENSRNEEVKRLLSMADSLSTDNPLELNKKRELFKKAEDILKIENKNNTKRVVQKVPWGVYNGMSFPREYYSESVRIPFEFTNIPVPVCYDRGANIKYGDYMHFTMGGAGHDYPYYMGQKRTLKEDFDYPVLYKFDEKEVFNNERDFSSSLKTVSGEMTDYIIECADVLAEIVRACKNASDDAPSEDDVLAYFADIQKNLVDFGTLVEKVKGDGTDTVSLLEGLCELIFALSESYLSDAGDDIINRISDKAASIVNAVNTEIINRKTVLFLPVKARYFNTLKPIINKAVADEDTDVYVAALPYYYKEYDGYIKGEELCEANEIASQLTGASVIPYRDVDLALMCPDEIYINMPYDNYNMAITVPSYFYASNIKKYTNKLIYVPFFMSMEFNKSNYPCFYNMQYYCTVPGVVLADEVLLQSENTREIYLEKLKEWSSEALIDSTSLSQYFDNKLKVITDYYPDYLKVFSFDEDSAFSDDLAGSLYSDKLSEIINSDKKKLLLYVNTGTLIEHGCKYFDKLYRILNTFKDTHSEICVLLMTDDYMEAVIKKHDINLWEKWDVFLKDFNDLSYGININSEKNHKFLKKYIHEICDAYYGNPSIICKNFIIAKKPVMLMNTGI